MNQSDNIKYYSMQTGADFLDISFQGLVKRVKKALILPDAWLITGKGLLPLFNKETLLKQPSKGFLPGRKKGQNAKK